MSPVWDWSANMGRVPHPLVFRPFLACTPSHRLSRVAALWCTPGLRPKPPAHPMASLAGSRAFHHALVSPGSAGRLTRAQWRAVCAPRNNCRSPTAQRESLAASSATGVDPQPAGEELIDEASTSGMAGRGAGGSGHPEGRGGGGRRLLALAPWCQLQQPPTSAQTFNIAA